MKDTLFSKKELLQSGWAKTKEHFWLLLSVLMFVLLITWATGYWWALSIVVSIFLSISIVTLSIDIADGRIPVFTDIFRKYRHWKIFVNYLISAILAGVIVLAGLLLIVVPGIYLAIRLQYYKFLIVDKENISPVMALKESWRMTEGHTWNLFLFMLLIILINFIGAMLLGIGLFVSVPVSLIAYAFLYRKLLVGLSLVTKPKV